MQAIHENKAVEYADLLVICQNSVSTKPGPQNPGYNLALKKYLISKKNVFIFSMLQSKDATGLDMLFNELDSANEPQVSCRQPVTACGIFLWLLLCFQAFHCSSISSLSPTHVQQCACVSPFNQTLLCQMPLIQYNTTAIYF